MRKGMVLLISIGLIWLLMSVVFVFLGHIHKAREDYVKERGMVQLSSLYTSLNAYLKNIELDDEMLFYASKMPFPIELQGVSLVLHVDSAHGKLPINTLLANALEDEKTYDKLVSYFRSYGVSSPLFLVDLLLDTIDLDMNERTFESEAILALPQLQQGKIDSLETLQLLLEYYRWQKSDEYIYEIPWEEMFHFEALTNVDLNYASLDVLRFLFDDANAFSLQRLVNRNTRMESVEDLPFDSSYNEKVIGTHYGVGVGITSNSARILTQAEDDTTKGEFLCFKTLGKRSRIWGLRVLDVQSTRD